jgi:hypothetical protein
MVHEEAIVFGHTGNMSVTQKVLVRDHLLSAGTELHIRYD